MKLIVIESFWDKNKVYHKVNETIELSQERYDEILDSRVKNCLKVLHEPVKKSVRRGLSDNA